MWFLIESVVFLCFVLQGRASVHHDNVEFLEIHSSFPDNSLNSTAWSVANIDLLAMMNGPHSHSLHIQIQNKGDEEVVVTGILASFTDGLFSSPPFFNVMRLFTFLFRFYLSVIVERQCDAHYY